MHHQRARREHHPVQCCCVGTALSVCARVMSRGPAPGAMACGSTRARLPRRDGRACGAQALICSALALPPTFFRRLVQSNGASSVLDFLPARGGAGGAPTLVVDRLNQARRSAPRARPSGFLVRPSIRRHRSCKVHCTAQAR